MRRPSPRPWSLLLFACVCACGAEAPTRGGHAGAESGPPPAAGAPEEPQPSEPPSQPRVTDEAPDARRQLAMLGDRVELVDVAVGGAHACALTEGKAVLCWGGNADGQLGGPRIIGNGFSLPLDRVEQVVAGSRHTCALRTDGEVRCWGASSSGQVGIGTHSALESRPQAVSGLGVARELAAGLAHTCAILGDRSVWCWGRNDLGTLGDGTRTSRPAPVRVPGISSARSIAAGGRHTCAVLEDGSTWCWGSSGAGQLGAAASDGSLTPVRVAGLPPVRRVVAGHEHGCALGRGGEVWCWGRNLARQVDPLAHEAIVTRPALVALPDVAVDVVAGFDRTCAVLRDGRAVCWGTGRDDVVVVGEYDRLATAGWASCGVREGEAWCWGEEIEGQRLPSNPRRVPASPFGIEHVTHITAGHDHACLVRLGVVHCWGANDEAQLGPRASGDSPVPVEVPLPVRVAVIAAGDSHTCALDDAGAVRCWGANDRRQLGRATRRATSAPVRVRLGARAVDVTAAGDRTCAELHGGRLVCWGAGERRPRTIGRLSSSHAIALGAAGVCSSDLAGHLQCWLGDPPSRPWSWSEMEVREPFVGDGFYCASLRVGDLACWADLERFGIPPERIAEAGDRPIYVPHAIRAADLDTSDTHTCIARETRGMQCWGQIDWHPMIDRVREVAVGHHFSCALDDAREHRGGGVICWGRNDRGQLGGGAVHDLPIAQWVIDPRVARDAAP